MPNVNSCIITDDLASEAISGHGAMVSKVLKLYRSPFSVYLSLFTASFEPEIESWLHDSNFGAR